MAVLTGSYQDAENILLQAGLTFRAILLNIYLHQWEKALDLAIKHKTHVDTVLAFRVKHLTRCEKEETIQKYIEYMKEVEIDWDQVRSGDLGYGLVTLLSNLCSLCFRSGPRLNRSTFESGMGVAKTPVVAIVGRNEKNEVTLYTQTTLII